MDADREQDRLARLATHTRAIYDRQAVAYDAGRRKDLFEINWLRRVVADVPTGGPVLDLGCGAGEPIAAWLVAQGFEVTGCDFSQPMLDLFAKRLPQARAIRADMRDLSLDQQFEAIIDWGAFFHLTRAEQRHALPQIASHLTPGGRLLLTVGPGEGEVTGHVGGEEVFHASLSLPEYTDLLAQAGAEVEEFVPNDPDCRGFSVLLARRPKL